jgi:DNA primase
MSVIDEIKSRLDIASYVGQFVTLKKAGRYQKACCPFHSEHTPSFVVNPDRQTWHCFGACAEGGDVFTFAMKQHGWSFGEALRELGKVVGVEVERQTPAQKERAERLDRLRGMLAAIMDKYHTVLTQPRSENAERALTYIQVERGLTGKTLESFGIGYAPAGWTNAVQYLEHYGYSADEIIEAGLAVRNDDGRVYDRFRNRLMIPIRDERGRIVGFGGRAFDDSEAKYINSAQSPLFDKSRVLYGLDTAKHSIRHSSIAVIVEGYMDVLQAHQAGFTNVVAQMGTALTEAQLKLLTSSASKIVLALDADAAGQSATQRSLETARGVLQADYSGRLSFDLRILHIPDAKDPDEVIHHVPSVWAQLVEDAIPVAQYVIDQECAALPTQPTVQEREAVARKLLPILTATENNLYRRDNIQQLALRLRFSEQELLTWTMPQPAPGAPILLSTPQQQAPEIERCCLRALIRHDQWWYEATRLLRSLANGDTRLFECGLGPLTLDDFTYATYRHFMALHLEALDQYEADSVDYIEAHLDDALRVEWELLMREPMPQTAFAADVTAIRAHRQAQVRDEFAAFVDGVYRLRLQRLREDMRALIATMEEYVEKQFDIYPLYSKAHALLSEGLSQKATV